MECYLVLKLLLPAAVVFIAMSKATAQEQSGFSLLPSNITARITFPARFDCRPSTGFVRWAVGDDVMLSNSSCFGCVLLDNSSLYFPSVTQIHAGRYTCFIVGVLGPTPRYSVYLTVAEAPRITSVTRANVTIIQNETLDINVSVTGVPQPNVTWRKDNENLNDDPRFTITGVNLRLPNAQPSDAGEYRITAQNIADTEVERFNVIVQFPPIITITRNPDSEMVEDDTTVTVTCMITSNPQSRISWEQITTNDRTDRTDHANTPIHLTNSFNIVSMSTISFTSEDINGFSTFCCSASNDIGLTSSCLNFTETGTPLMPTEFRLTGNTSSSVSVSWMSSSTGSDIIYELSWHGNGIPVNTTMLPSNVMSYTIEGLEANTQYVLTINARNTKTEKSSATTSITVNTLVAVPGDVVGFNVEVLRMEKIFQLTWQAPVGSQVTHYIIYIEVSNERIVETLDDASTAYEYSNLQENIEYRFAVQAVNIAGSGPVSNYMAVFFCSSGSLLSIKFQRSSYSINVNWDITSVFDPNGIYLIVRDRNNAEFTTPQISDGTPSQCINGLEPDTDYSLTVTAVFNCYNISETVDFTTLGAGSSSSNLPSQDCIMYRPQVGFPSDDPEGKEDSGLEAWAIALIVILPLVGLVVMLSIGIYCGLKMKSTSKDPGDLPDDNNAATYNRQRQQEYQPRQLEMQYPQRHQQQQYMLQQQHSNFSQQQLINRPYSPRNNSTSSYPNGSTSDYRSGSTSPAVTVVSSNGRPYQPYPLRMPHEQPATQV